MPELFEVIGKLAARYPIVGVIFVAIVALDVFYRLRKVKRENPDEYIKETKRWLKILVISVIIIGGLLLLITLVSM